MALIKTIEEVVRYVSLNTNNDFDKVLPDIEDVEQNIIIPTIGEDFYNEIETAYQDDNLTPEQVKVKNQLQNCVSNFAIAENIDITQVQISDGGIVRREDTSTKTAYRYQKDEVKQYLLRKAWGCIDNLLKFLEENKDDYPTWRDSPEATINKELIINDAVVFSEHYFIEQSRLLYNSLRSIIKITEELDLEEVIGEDLLTEIKDEIRDSSVSADNQLLLDKFIYSTLTHLVVFKALNDRVAVLTEKGVLMFEKKAVLDSSRTETTPNDMAMDAKKFYAQNIGNRYMEKLRCYLNENASDLKYATYFDSDKYEEPNPTEEEVIDESNIYNGL